MVLQLFNTLTRNKELFTPLVKGNVGMYTCGPTVYNYVHIGNLRAYVAQDLLKRYLNYKGFKVKHVMNFTDVDDKTIRDSQKEHKSLTEFTRFYEQEYLKDIKALHILPADIMPRATEHISEMVKLIIDLEKNKHTYEKDGSIYFKIASFKGYGKLANLDAQLLKDNADGRFSQDEYEKENARDFALWKSYSDEDGDVCWDTALGKGRPGWHIECSAMSTKYLGDTFDIHCGGVDLIFPHHTNEIAQTEGATKKPFVKYWVHNEHLLVDGQKMSKSLGNFYTLRDLIKKGYDPLVVRYELLSTHYRQQLNFTEGSLKQSEAALRRLYEFIDRLDDCKGEGSNVLVQESIATAKRKFDDAMDDDLNISSALAAVFDFLREINALIDKKKLSISDAKEVRGSILLFDSVLGLLKSIKENIIRGEIKQLAEDRLAAKKSKDFSLSDSLRKKINDLGFRIDDTAEGYKLKKI